MFAFGSYKLQCALRFDGWDVLHTQTRQAPIPHPILSSNETKQGVLIPRSSRPLFNAFNITGGPQEIIASTSGISSKKACTAFGPVFDITKVEL